MYHITTNNFLVSGSGLSDFSRLLYDKWEAFHEQSLQNHFEKSCTIFLKRLEKMQVKEKAPTEKDKKDLTFMLESLLDTKCIIAETKKTF